MSPGELRSPTFPFRGNYVLEGQAVELNEYGETMRIWTIVVALAASTLFGGSSPNGQGAYCIVTRGYENCSYASLEACHRTRNGMGGICAPNPRYQEAPERRPSQRR
jgi:hypothetical protein